MAERTFPLYESYVSRRLVDLIERNAEELTRAYVDTILRDHRMPRYHNFDRAQVSARAHRVFSQLGRWISRDISRDEIRDYWMTLGRERRREGFAVSELILSLCYIRRTLWEKIQSEGLLDTALDFAQAMDLHHRVLLFFDKAIHYAAAGFEEDA